MTSELPEGFTLDTVAVEKSPVLPSGFTIDTDEDQVQTQLKDTEYQDQAFVDAPIQTIKDISSLYPALETGLNLLTSSYGIPASGLGGLATLLATGDLGKADRAVKSISDAIVYMPKTEAGERLTETVSYPFTQYEKLAQSAGDTIDEFGFPNVAAGVHTAISAAPTFAGAKIASRSPKAKAISKIDAETSAAIKKGINKSIRPSVAKKSTNRQVRKYFDQAESAVSEIIKNKDNLNIVDEYGSKIEGLPKTLDQFSQAIEQTKKGIFEEYDSLAKKSDAARYRRPVKYPIKEGEYPVFDASGRRIGIESPIKIDLNKTSKKLDSVIDSKIVQDFSPETIEYAKLRANVLSGRKKYTAVETQEAIQLLNQSLDQFYRDPSPATKGKAVVDSIIANELRKQLDSSIRRTTGKKYSVLKKKYGDLKAIEKDVTKRSIVDARKNDKGLIDFSDIFSGAEAVRAIVSKDPVSGAAALGARGTARWYKYLNDPNRYVKNMFNEVEKLQKKRQIEVTR